jgi:AraC-like DNA-binding protein
VVDSQYLAFFAAAFFSSGVLLLSFDVMGRQSFASWHLPRSLDGLLLFEDLSSGKSRFRLEERHFHDELELHFVERGRCLFVLEDRQFELGAGAMLWIAPRRDHLLIETSPDLRRWLLLARVKAVSKVLPKAALARVMGPQPIESGVLPARHAAALRRTYAELRPQLRAESPLPNAAIGYALARSYLVYESAGKKSDASALHPAVSHALRVLREGSPPLSLSELARRCRVSEAHLSKMFASQVGVSVTDFRNRVRLERFLEAYGDGSGPSLFAAALDAGFGSYPQFHRVFCRLMGYPPGAHRREQGGD